MKILNFGSMNIDKIYHVNQIVRSHETVSTLRMNEELGGKGLNQSIALAKAGANVFHAGKVGETDGDRLVDKLEENGINVSMIQRSKNQSGHAIIQINKDFDNAIIVHGGANQEIDEKQIDAVWNEFKKEDWLLIQNEISNIPYIMKKAKDKEMRIIMNPSPITMELLTYPLELVDVFILNEVEGETLTSKKEPTEILAALKQKYPHAMIFLTLGKKGVLAWDTKKVYSQPSYVVETVDPTGAGDTFTGYLIGSMAKNIEIQECLKLASAASAMSVMNLGASNSIPELDKVIAWMKEH